MSIEEKLRSAAAAAGIELLGFGDKSRFAGVDAQHNPFTIFPEGKSVIVLGKRICRGSLRGVEEGTNFSDYSLYGYGWLEDEFLTIACYDLARALEDEGFEAVPIFPNPPEIQPQGVAVAEGKTPPNVYPDMEYAAVACGIAEYGFDRRILTPEFGPRQRFHMIITDAELKPTPMLSVSVCDRCRKCAEACPLGAISGDACDVIEVCGNKYPVASVDYNLCRSCKNGAKTNRLFKSGKPDRIAALCSRSCMCMLEEKSLVSNRFVSPFRTRSEWALDAAGKPVKADGSAEKRL